MEPMDQSVCENCGGKPARFFLTTIISGVKASRSLCQACHEAALSGPAKQFVDDLKAGRCQYCGAQAATTDSMWQILGGPGAEPRYLCFSCSQESNKVAMEKFGLLGKEPESLPFSEQQAKLREISEQIDDHMRRWVVRRDN